jgi:hypothetical protein
MEMIRWVGVVGLLLCSGLAQAGDIHTCKGKGGVNVYQNSPCPKPADELNHAAYDASMGRAADGSSGHTERGAYAPSLRRQMPARDSSAPVADINYSGSSATPAQTQPTLAGGIGSSAYQRGEVRGTRCVNADGHVYFTAGACGSSVSYAGDQPVDWHRDQVQGVPGAVMIGPNQALDPMTNQIVQLIETPQVAPTYMRTRDSGTHVGADEACAGARKAAAGRFNKRADDRVQELCRFGRSMHDQTPSGGIP